MVGGNKKKYVFLDIWEHQSSERAKLKISRMLDPKEEKEYALREHMLKDLETSEQNKIEGKKRRESKINDEKYYFNSIITGFDGNPFRTKGFSIRRKQIQLLIDALQSIQNGDFEEFIESILVESNIHSNDSTKTNSVVTGNSFEDEVSEEEVGETSKETGFEEWYVNLDEKIKQDVDKMRKTGWTEEDIRLAVESKESGDE
jgi:hypothetical protein